MFISKFQKNKETLHSWNKTRNILFVQRMRKLVKNVKYGSKKNISVQLLEDKNQGHFP